MSEPKKSIAQGESVLVDDCIDAGLKTMSGVIAEPGRSMSGLIHLTHRVSRTNPVQSFDRHRASGISTAQLRFLG